ncbi:JAB domain-containing protein [uncultured Trichococcus sp.]|uniref:JAB domain-containing protein n=1 Tax=uncultured Trichococcus sp. TaxID=189665 RepID=UPI003747E256
MKVSGQLSSWSCLASSRFRLSEKKKTVKMREFLSHFHCLLFVNTLKLMTLGDLMGIRLLDHLIIGDGHFISLKEQGFL